MIMNFIIFVFVLFLTYTCCHVGIIKVSKNTNNIFILIIILNC